MSEIWLWSAEKQARRGKTNRKIKPITYIEFPTGNWEIEDKKKKKR